MAKIISLITGTTGAGSGGSGVAAPNVLTTTTAAAIFRQMGHDEEFSFTGTVQLPTTDPDYAAHFKRLTINCINPSGVKTQICDFDAFPGTSLVYTGLVYFPQPAGSVPESWKVEFVASNEGGSPTDGAIQKTVSVNPVSANVVAVVGTEIPSSRWQDSGSALHVAVYAHTTASAARIPTTATIWTTSPQYGRIWHGWFNVTATSQFIRIGDKDSGTDLFAPDNDETWTVTACGGAIDSNVAPPSYAVTSAGFTMNAATAPTSTKATGAYVDSITYAEANGTHLFGWPHAYVTLPLTDPEFWFARLTLQTGTGTGGSFVPGGVHPVETNVGDWANDGDHGDGFYRVGTSNQIYNYNPNYWNVPTDTNITHRFRWYVTSRRGGPAGTTVLQNCWSSAVGNSSAGTNAYQDMVVDGTKGEINGAAITASTIQATSIASINGSVINASTIQASSIGSINGSVINASTIQASSIGSINGAVINASTIQASSIGSINGAVINAGTIAASSIGSVNGSSIVASTITAAAIASVNGSSIVASSITAAAIASVNGSSIVASSIAATAIASINGGVIQTGTIVASSIASVNASVISNLGALDIGAMQGSIGIGSISNLNTFNVGSFSGVLVTSQIAAGILNSLSMFGSDVRPIKIVAVLPTLPDANYPLNCSVSLSTDGKLYRNISDAWSSNVAGSDVTGALSTSATIEAVKITTLNGLITAAQVGSITGSTINGAINSTCITSVQGSVITGQVTASSITYINVGSFAGQITASQILNASIAGSKITNGTIGAAQITNGSIAGSHIGQATIQAYNIQGQTITASEIQNLTITAEQIRDLTITGGKIAAAQIGDAHITNLAASKITAGSLTVTSWNNGITVNYSGDNRNTVIWPGQTSWNNNSGTMVGYFNATADSLTDSQFAMQNSGSRATMLLLEGRTGNISTYNGGKITSNGDLTSWGNIYANGAVGSINGKSLSVTGNVSCGSISCSGTISGTHSGSWSGTFSTTGVSASGTVSAGTVSCSGTVSGGTVSGSAFTFAGDSGITTTALAIRKEDGSVGYLRFTKGGLVAITW